MSVTWNAATPPELPLLSPSQRLRGVARLTAAIGLTILLLCLFVPGVLIRRHVWRGWSAHFLVARFWSRAMLALLGARWSRRGAPMRHPGAALANHSSWGDILALRSATTLHFVSKAEVRGWPGVGWIARMCDTVFIERRRAAAAEQREGLRARVAAGQTLAIFPEGTSSDSLRVLPFKSALLSALYAEGVRERAWVQPVTVNWIAPAGLPPEFYGWWGDMDFGAHLWQVACRSVGGRVEVVFHDPIRIEGGPDRKALARLAEEAVRSAKEPDVTRAAG